MKVNEKIRYYRKLFKLTQDEVGDACSVDRSTVANWEAGKRTPNLTYLKILSSLFGFSLNEFDDEFDSSESRLATYKKIEIIIDDSIEYEGDDFQINCEQIIFSYSHCFIVDLSNVEFPFIETLQKSFNEYDPNIHKLEKHSLFVPIFNMVITLAMLLALAIFIPIDLHSKNNLHAFSLDTIDKVELEVKIENEISYFTFDTFNSSLYSMENKYKFSFDSNINYYIAERIDLLALYNDELIFSKSRAYLTLYLYSNQEVVSSSDYITLNLIDSEHNKVLFVNNTLYPYIEEPGIYDIIFYTTNNSYYLGAFLNLVNSNIERK